eukprot:Gregarina_sp_Poly_1__2866@NODE_17_length_22522_cov_92_073614_g15_i0_p18_GENE_NODE_17_length_22522_cov_92_073614_g15_i0NODE_17_length_22522_cov_92_073614_g15_i0_p18_ORF_typecomplete_len120_score1_43Chlam_OMP/PF01308_17/0_08_NODE_17_length_22522_cov_92_073614_g15_i056616020
MDPPREVNGAVLAISVSASVVVFFALPAGDPSIPMIPRSKTVHPQGSHNAICDPSTLMHPIRCSPRVSARPQPSSLSSSSAAPNWGRGFCHAPPSEDDPQSSHTSVEAYPQFNKCLSPS